MRLMAVTEYASGIFSAKLPHPGGRLPEREAVREDAYSVRDDRMNSQMVCIAPAQRRVASNE